MFKWFQTIWTVLVVKQSYIWQSPFFDDQSSNSATFSSKFAQIKKWIYKIFGTLKNNLIYAQVAKVLPYILCIVATIETWKNTKDIVLFHSIQPKCQALDLQCPLLL
jgi:hypothetical protein